MAKAKKKAAPKKKAAKKVSKAAKKVAGKYELLAEPTQGETIKVVKGQLQVPNNPIIPFIEGDGTGPDIWAASQRVIDAAVEKAYGGKKEIVWFEVYAGEKSKTKF